MVDMGCGGGILSEELCRIGAHVTGVDASPENVPPASSKPHPNNPSPPPVSF